MFAATGLTAPVAPLPSLPAPLALGHASCCSGSWRSTSSRPTAPEVSGACQAFAAGCLAAFSARGTQQLRELRAPRARQRPRVQAAATADVQAPPERAAAPAGFASPPPLTGDEDAPRQRALKAWLVANGAIGVDAVETGKTGVWLKTSSRERRSGDRVLMVPKKCWIAFSSKDDSLDLSLELAWTLLQERWKGADSFFAPFVDVLCSYDLSTHPMNWTSEELTWLDSSFDARALAAEMRATLAERTAVLLERARATDVGGLLTPSGEELEAQIRWALIHVESRATETVDLQEAVEEVHAILVPVFENMRHDYYWSLEVGVDADNLNEYCAFARRLIKPGAPLRHAFSVDEAIGPHDLLLCHGFAKRFPITAENRDEVMRNWLKTRFVCPSFPTILDQPLDGKERRLKTDMLASECDTDWDWAKNGERPVVLTFPDDLRASAEFPSGKLWAMTRFLSIPATPDHGESLEEACRRQFETTVKGEYVHLDFKDLLDDPQRLESEYVVRCLIKDILVSHGDRQKKSVNILQDNIRTMLREAEESAIAQALGGEGLDLEEDMNIMAHFKTKGPNGEVVRSKKPKQAKVLAVDKDGDEVTLMFDNGVRHKVPRAWVVNFAEEAPVMMGSTKKRAGVSSGGKEKTQKPLTAERCKLAMFMLDCERALVGAYATDFDDYVWTHLELMKVAKTEDRVYIDKLLQRLGTYWLRDHQRLVPEKKDSEEMRQALEHLDAEEQEKMVKGFQ